LPGRFTDRREKFINLCIDLKFRCDIKLSGCVDISAKEHFTMEKYQQTASSLFGSLKNAVLGNPVTREYQVGKQVASFGPGLSWKVFEGKKKTTGQEVSVFVLEKKLIDSYDKRDREPILEVFRKGPQQLAKLRHPRLLTVQHTLEESRDSLAFATEPVFASLANVLGKIEALPQNAIEELRSYELFDVEKVYGLLQIVEGLAFLHNDVKLVEGNITPSNIILTKDGHWKLAGFNFSTPSEHAMQNTVNWESRMPLVAKPELNYIAPEYILCQAREFASDMYSFGCLVNAVYNPLKTPFDASNNVQSYKKCIEQFCRLGSDYMKDIPIIMRDHVKSLLNIAPGVRPDANQTIKHKLFDDVAAMTLKYLHTLVQRDDMTKSQFFKGLHRVLPKLPKRVIHQRILPHLCLEFPNHAMIPFVLPNVLLIAEECTTQEFVDLVLPELKKIFSVQEPVQVLLIFMQKMELLLKKTPNEDVKNHVLPMVFRALESQSSQIQELVLSIIPNFAHMIDYTTLKHSIVPRVKKLVLGTSILSVRVNALVCIGKIIEYLDKFLMIDDVFPILTQIPSKEPAVLMAILGIYKKTMADKKINLETDYLAGKVIPFLLPLSVDSGLNVQQFNNFMSVIRDMLDRIDQEHRTKLEQLSKLQEQQKSVLEFSKAVDESHNMQEMLDKVDSLVLGSPEKAESSSHSSEFSKMFGIINDDCSRVRSEPNAVIAKDPRSAPTNASVHKPKENSSTPISSLTNKGNFHPLPFDGAASGKPSDLSRTRAYNESDNDRETGSLLGKEAVKSSSIGSFNFQPQNKQQSSQNNHSNKFLDSMLMRNAGLQPSSGTPASMMNLDSLVTSQGYTQSTPIDQFESSNQYQSQSMLPNMYGNASMNMTSRQQFSNSGIPRQQQKSSEILMPSKVNIANDDFRDLLL